MTDNVNRDMLIFSKVKSAITDAMIDAINLSDRLKQQLWAYEANVVAERDEAIQFASGVVAQVEQVSQPNGSVRQEMSLGLGWFGSGPDQFVKVLSHEIGHYAHIAEDNQARAAAGADLNRQITTCLTVEGWAWVNNFRIQEELAAKGYHIGLLGGGGGSIAVEARAIDAELQMQLRTPAERNEALAYFFGQKTAGNVTSVDPASTYAAFCRAQAEDIFHPAATTTSPAPFVQFEDRLLPDGTVESSVSVSQEPGSEGVVRQTFFSDGSREVTYVDSTGASYDADGVVTATVAYTPDRATYTRLDATGVPTGVVETKWIDGSFATVSPGEDAGAYYVGTVNAAGSAGAGFTLSGLSSPPVAIEGGMISAGLSNGAVTVVHPRAGVATLTQGGTSVTVSGAAGLTLTPDAAGNTGIDLGAGQSVLVSESGAGQRLAIQPGQRRSPRQSLRPTGLRQPELYLQFGQFLGR